MKHYLLLRFPPDFLTDALFDFTCGTFQGLRDQIGGILDVSVFRNCVPRDSNMDLMVVMDLASREALSDYLDHPLHLQFVARVGGHAIERSTFDHET